MITTEIILLTNNIVIPFQNIGLEFVEFNKLFATQSLAEHGLAFMIKVYEKQDPKDEWGAELLKKIIFDTGSMNLTFLHNVDVRGYSLYDANAIILSHWHYDHTGALFKVLERIEDEIPVICHEAALNERFFRRAGDVKASDLKGKSREEIVHLLSLSKIVNQPPMDLKHIKELNGKVMLSKDPIDIFKSDELKIILSGEIPRNHPEEEFHGFFSLQDGILKEDIILDDKCLIFEFQENVVVLNGCCHSGIMNTLDYVKTLTDKPISHVIGGFHMASATDKTVQNTVDYLENFQDNDDILYLFPIHCSGDAILNKLREKSKDKIKAFNASVGTMFKF